MTIAVAVCCNYVVAPAIISTNPLALLLFVLTPLSLQYSSMLFIHIYTVLEKKYYAMAKPKGFRTWNILDLCIFCKHSRGLVEIMCVRFIVLTQCLKRVLLEPTKY